ncbi:MAG TPA: FeoA domain-containing protein [Longimicrobiales bacterium]
MATGYSPAPVRSLAATRTGEAVLIHRILFGALRALCSDLGVHEGDVVHCRAGTPSHILLLTDAGRTVSLERDWARFIQVRSPTGDATPRKPAQTDRAAVM